ncbi:MAG: threonine--tRNA ligase [Patescibacteria group bacterium]
MKNNNQNNQEALDHLRHSCAHLLAAAVMEIWPDTKRTIGPSIENGFYYDFEFVNPISEKDFVRIEQKMHELVKKWNGFERDEVTKEEALRRVEGNEYKKELIEEFAGKGEKLSFYKSGNFEDLCRGGHSENPKDELKYFRLTSVAGAYWRGDEKNKMLTRIYGTIFPSREELENHFKLLEEAKKRDHRKLGKELDLFTFSPLIGSGLPLYTPRGALIRRLLNDYVEETQRKEGYSQVWTPQIAKADLFKTSGHYDKYKADMFRVVSNYSDEEMYLKPMNCPQHTQIYASKPRSYRDLPIRMTDFAMLYRDERPGELNGLARVRSFSQDDCHVFCREDQVDEEIDRALAMTKKIMKTFGFKYRYRLSTRDLAHPEKYIGDPKVWDKLEKWAVEIMKRNNIEYYDGPGEAAFYAPKMDLMATDALGREWQLSTVQIDFFMPERFKLTYTDSDGQDKRPVMLHRAILGSAERLMMVLIEHYGGAFPLWLAPTQVAILPVADRHVETARRSFDLFKASGIRTELDESNKTLGAKIREWTLQKVPYLCIIGDKESSDSVGDGHALPVQRVTVRTRAGKDLGVLEVNDFISKLQESIGTKTTE